MGTEYWAIVAGILALVLLLVIISANLLVGALKRRRMLKQHRRELL